MKGDELGTSLAGGESASAAVRPRGSRWSGVADLRWALALCLVLGALIMGLAEVGYDRLSDVFVELQDSRRLYRDLRELNLLVVEAETGQRGYLLTRRPEFLDPYRSAIRQMPAALDRVASAIHGDAEREALFASIRETVDRKLVQLREAVELVDSGDADEALALVESGRGRATMDALRQQLARFEDSESRRIRTLDALWHNDLALLRLTVATAVSAALILLMLLMRSTRRMLVLEREQVERLDGERARLDEAVRARTQELSELASHLQAVREDEKAALARELHDELGAILAASKMNLASIERGTPQMPDELRTRLATLRELLDRGVDLKRRVIDGLVPTTLRDLGLNAALRVLADELTATAKLEVVTQLPAREPELGAEQAIALYRVVQEALTNVLRHARATRATVTLALAGPRLLLSVVDNGVGLRPEDAARPGSHGLRGMRQRVAALSGTLEIDSRAGRGTAISVEMPLVTR